MTITELSQLILATSSLITPSIAIIGYISLHSKSSSIQSTIEEVKRETNGMKAELVTSVREASMAKGILQGKLEQKAISGETQETYTKS